MTITTLEDTAKFSIEKLTASNRDSQLESAANLALDKAQFAIGKFKDAIKQKGTPQRAVSIEQSLIACSNSMLDLGFLTGCQIVVGDYSTTKFKENLSKATELACKVARAVDANLTDRNDEFKAGDPAVHFPNWARAGGVPTPSWADHMSRQQLCQIIYERLVDLVKEVGKGKKSSDSLTAEQTKDWLYSYLSAKFLIGVVTGLNFCKPEDFDKIVVSAADSSKVNILTIIEKAIGAMEKHGVDKLVAKETVKRFP